MKHKLLIVGLVMILGSCAKPEKKIDDGGWDVILRGKVGFPQQGTIEVSEIGFAEAADVDTLTLSDSYTFEKTVHLTQPGYYRINFYGQQYVDFILDKTNLEINVDGNSQSGFAEVKGSPDHALMVEVQRIMQSAQSGPAFESLEARFQEAQRLNNHKQISALQEEYAATLARTRDSLVTVLDAKPVSLGMINVLEGNTFDDKDKYFDFYQKTANRIATEMPKSRYGMKFSEMVSKMAITAIGQQAPEIALPSPGGDTIKLSSLQGKYVLVDFWAKWCGPCRRENPNVVKAYHKYKANGFEILGVSLDRNRADWLQAIAEDGLKWKHVSDLKYFESQAAVDYNINAIPFSILVDPSGVIVAKNLRGDGLDKKLSEIFRKKS